MNSCILMAEIIENPKLRYTPDNQTPVADMLVQFPGLRAEEPPSTLRVVGWGNLAQEIQERYHQGDQVVIEGRLTMSTVEKQGYKEKVAELTAQRIHPMGMQSGARLSQATIASTASPVAPSMSTMGGAGDVIGSAQPTPKPVAARAAVSKAAPPPTDYDDIPF